MSAAILHPLAADYVQRLQRAARTLPPVRRAELVREIEEYLAEVAAPDATDDTALAAIERLGPVGDIVEAELERAPAAPVRIDAAAGGDRRTWQEWAAVLLLPLGGFVFAIGWIAGVILLWTSPRWSVRQKLLGTCVAPGGLALAPVLLLAAGGIETSSSGGGMCYATTSSTGGTSQHCTTFPATSSGSPALQIVVVVAVIVYFIVAPIVTSVYLARAAR